MHCHHSNCSVAHVSTKESPQTSSIIKLVTSKSFGVGSRTSLTFEWGSQLSLVPKITDASAWKVGYVTAEIIHLSLFLIKPYLWHIFISEWECSILFLVCSCFSMNIIIINHILFLHMERKKSCQNLKPYTSHIWILTGCHGNMKGIG